MSTALLMSRRPRRGCLLPSPADGGSPGRSKETIMQRGMKAAAVVAAAVAALAVSPLSPASAGTVRTGDVGTGGGSTYNKCGAQLFGNRGFETGTAAPWEAWLDGVGATHTDTLSQTVTLPSGCASYTLSFWLYIDTFETTTTSKFDTMVVKADSATLATYSNLDHSGYAQKSFSLAGMAGQTVTISFTGTEDASLQTSFVIDDTATTVT